MLDRANDHCGELKGKFEQAEAEARLDAPLRCSDGAWQVVERIVVEELEAWYFGDWEAVRQAYPRVPPVVQDRGPFRDPDGIQGGTWEAFERILKDEGQFLSGEDLLADVTDPIDFPLLAR